MNYQISRRVVLFGALPAACGLAKTQDGTASAFAQAPQRRLVPTQSRPEPVIDARAFGASPSASAADNSAAFRLASRAIEQAGGGTLLIPPGEYRVGQQVRRDGKLVPLDIIRIEGCARDVLVTGGGATLKAADGLWYGAFDPVSGTPRDGPVPFTDPAWRVDGCLMILVAGCRGDVRIEGMRLDGNSTNFVLGGQWGDHGRQLGSDGVACSNNTGSVTIANVHCRDHGRDGIMLSHYGLKADSPRFPVTVTDVTCDMNARQGLSWIGGTQLTVIRSHFTRTSRGRFSSAPGAGVDIEAEGSVCRNGRFVDCRFVDNGGVGFVADSGDSADVECVRCEFVGTIFWSAWPRKPGFVFRDCLFVGTVVNVHGDPDPRRATQFYNCRFHADAGLSPTRTIYGGNLLDLGAGARNVLFKDCDFRAVEPRVSLPWTFADVRYDNCTFRQAGTNPSYTRGVFTGTNTVVSAGAVETWGSQFQGPFIVNGKRIH